MITADEANQLTKKSEAAFQEFLNRIQSKIKSAANGGDYYTYIELPEEISERACFSLSNAGYKFPDKLKGNVKITW